MIDDIKFSTGDMSRQFELQQPFGIDIVMDGFFGDDGDAEAAGNKVFDGFLIIDAGSNMEFIFGKAEADLPVPLPCSRKMTGCS